MQKIIDEFSAKAIITVNSIRDVVGEAFNIGQASAMAAILHHMYKARDKGMNLEQVITEIQEGHRDKDDMSAMIQNMINALREEEAHG